MNLQTGSPQANKPTLFEITLAKLGISHKLIRPYTPRHNGKVERSHREDHNKFYSCHSFYSCADLNVQLTARLTDIKFILTEDEENALNDRIAFLSEILPERPLVGVTYFVRDKKKEGGAYFTKIGNVRRVDEIGRKIVFTDGTVIPLDDVVSVEGEVFEEMY